MAAFAAALQLEVPARKLAMLCQMVRTSAGGTYNARHITQHDTCPASNGRADVACSISNFCPLPVAPCTGGERSGGCAMWSDGSDDGSAGPAAAPAGTRLPPRAAAAARRHPR